MRTHQVRMRTEITYHRLHEGISRQKRITIALVGAGGNGSQMVTCLARMDRAMRELHGVRLDVDLYDPDIITAANIGRQLFYPTEIGQHKAFALIHRANISFGLQWQAFPQRYAGQFCKSAPDSRLTESSYDFLITCVDTGEARMRIYEAVNAKDQASARYWMDLGNEGSTGQVILGEFDKQVFSRSRPRLLTTIERFPEFYDGTVPESDTPSCSLAEALGKQDLFINDHVARWASHLLWRLLIDMRTRYVGYFINLIDGQVRGIPAPYDAAAKETPRRTTTMLPAL